MVKEEHRNIHILLLYQLPILIALQAPKGPIPTCLDVHHQECNGLLQILASASEKSLLHSKLYLINPFYTTTSTRNCIAFDFCLYKETHCHIYFGFLDPSILYARQVQVRKFIPFVPSLHMPHPPDYILHSNKGED